MPIQSNQPENMRQQRKMAFSLRLLLRCPIARLGTFSVDPGILVSYYASVYHPHTTVATGVRMIF